MKNEHSIAAIIFNENKFLLLKYGLGHWGFVKGHKEKGETNKETILRELKEETGISNAEIIDNFRKNYEYYFRFRGDLIHKVVDCYLIHSETQNVKLSFEHVGYKWLSIDDAIKQATYDNAKKILKKTKKFLKLMNLIKNK
ncbi:MAG: NUDIX domain-containing protein [Candidatus Lokiarchaeota archaeon]